MEVNINTDEKILLISLDLFSQRGYSGVSVRDIAKEVGVRESALYKHYKNKEDIFNRIIIEVNKKIEEAYSKNSVPKIDSNTITEDYRNLSVDMLSQISWNLFQLYVKDPIISSYRKLLSREQYNNSLAQKMYRKTFVEGPINSEAFLFEQFVKSGFFRKEDPRIIALHFYGPIFLLFQKYDMEPNDNEIEQMIKEHVRVFSNNYRMDGCVVNEGE